MLVFTWYGDIFNNTLQFIRIWNIPYLYPVWLHSMCINMHIYSDKYWCIYLYLWHLNNFLEIKKSIPFFNIRWTPKEPVVHYLMKKAVDWCFYRIEAKVFQPVCRGSISVHVDCGVKKIKPIQFKLTSSGPGAFYTQMNFYQLFIQLFIQGQGSTLSKLLVANGLTFEDSVDQAFKMKTLDQTSIV